MRLECTKKEWAILETMLTTGHSTSVSYKYPFFEAVFYDNDTAKKTFHIDGMFTDPIEGTVK